LSAAGPEGRRIPPVSIWQGTADTLVVPRKQQELVEQWTAVHGISSTPARSERKGSIMRELFSDTAGDVRVESALVDGLAHAFPIHPDRASSCGQPGNFVVAADVCGAIEITRFWGLSGAN
jgi:poly(3-hydroxybutyrate) depolymerase